MPADELTSDDRVAMAASVARIGQDYLDVDSFVESDPDFELFHCILTEDIHRALEAAYLAGRNARSAGDLEPARRAARPRRRRETRRTRS